jgi:hypothetical protein
MRKKENVTDETRRADPHITHVGLIRFIAAANHAVGIRHLTRSGNPRCRLP